MELAELKNRFDHPTWFTAAGTFVAYGLILVAMTLLLFGLPLVVFWLL